MNPPLTRSLSAACTHSSDRRGRGCQSHGYQPERSQRNSLPVMLPGFCLVQMTEKDVLLSREFVWTGHPGCSEGSEEPVMAELTCESVDTGAARNPFFVDVERQPARLDRRHQLSPYLQRAHFPMALEPRMSGGHVGLIIARPTTTKTTAIRNTTVKTTFEKRARTKKANPPQEPSPAVLLGAIREPGCDAGRVHDGRPERGLRNERQVVLTQDAGETCQRNHATVSPGRLERDSSPPAHAVGRTTRFTIRHLSHRRHGLRLVDTNAVID